MVQGDGRFRYRVVEGWGQGPQGREFGGVVPAVAVDSQGRVYITRRKPPAILVYDETGRFLTAWGEDLFLNPHSIWISPDDRLYVTDVDDHTMRILDTNGHVLATLGTPGQPGPPDQPFNRPAWAALAAWGELYVADGYGQFRVHRFSANGELIQSWGSWGTGPGQFALPHCLRIDRHGRVLVADRENNRIQLFDATGVYLGEWTDVSGPNDIFIDQDDTVYVAEAPHRISIFTLDGQLLARWGEKGDRPGQFPDHPHGIWVDPQGNLYITEVPWLDNRLQKFERVA